MMRMVVINVEKEMFCGCNFDIVDGFIFGIK